MAILTKAEIPVYASKSASLLAANPDQCDGIIDRAQELAEGELGANRPLEISLTTQTGLLENEDYQFSIYLDTFPVVQDEDHPFVVEIRQDVITSNISTPYKVLATDKYYLDADGLIIIPYERFYSFQRIPLTSSNFRAKLSYYSGLDFTASTPETRGVKAALGAVIDYFLSPGYQGIEEVKLPFNEAATKYSTQINPGTIPDSYLTPFRKYRKTPSIN